MILVQEILKKNIQDDSSTLQVLTMVFYTFKFYNQLKPTQSANCSIRGWKCFPHNLQKHVPKPSPMLALKHHTASQIRKLIWQKPNPPKKDKMQFSVSRYRSGSLHGSTSADARTRETGMSVWGGDAVESWGEQQLWCCFITF